MAELEDAPDSKSGDRKVVKVQFLSPAPIFLRGHIDGWRKENFHCSRAVSSLPRDLETRHSVGFRDAAGAYELFHDADAFHDNLAGTEDFVLAEWQKTNQQLIESGFQRDNLMGESNSQRFIS